MTCAKRRVVCIIRDMAGNVIGLGTNDVAVPQKVCPRAPGEDYEKCQSVCGQPGHAEIMAIEDAVRHGHSLDYARVDVYGHDHVCPACLEVLKTFGVARVRVWCDEPPHPGAIN